MSLLDAIVSRKSVLKSIETRITTVTGQILMEKTCASGEKVRVVLNESSAGYVIDEIPDMQVAFVFPWLCLGSQDVVCDEELVMKMKITHVLSLGVAPAIQFPTIDYKFLPMYDEPGYKIINHIPDCITYIDSCHEKQATVFVHCNAGVSRCATIAIAYVMKHLSVGVNEAFHMVKQARACIKPNPGFMLQLKEWEETLVKESSL